MIVVDTSVWIDHLRDVSSREVQVLRYEIPEDAVVIGDLVLFELLQGARDDLHAARLERSLQAFETRRMVDDAVIRQAARIYRDLRGEGVTVRKAVDLLIASFCIVHSHDLLQKDRDFAPIAKRFGLRLL